MTHEPEPNEDEDRESDGDQLRHARRLGAVALRREVERVEVGE